MASSSEDTYGHQQAFEDNEDSFDEAFDQAFENVCNTYGHQEGQKKKQEKYENLSNETVKKTISGYGIIISVTLPHILKIYSDDDLE